MLHQKFASQLVKLKEDMAAYSQTAIHEKFTSTVARITEWKYSTGEYFDRLPFDDERQGYAPPKLITKKYKDFNEARWLGKYCAGFIENQHVITIQPEEQGIKKISADLYERQDAKTDVWSTTHRWNEKLNRQESNLLSLGRFETLSNALLYIGVGPDDEYSIYLYTYSDEGVLLHTELGARGYQQDFRWTYHYDSEGKLSEIRTGSVVLWPKK